MTFVWVRPTDLSHHRRRSRLLEYPGFQEFLCLIFRSWPYLSLSLCTWVALYFFSFMSLFLLVICFLFSPMTCLKFASSLSIICVLIILDFYRNLNNCCFWNMYMLCISTSFRVLRTDILFISRFQPFFVHFKKKIHFFVHFQTFFVDFRFRTYLFG